MPLDHTTVQALAALFAAGGTNRAAHRQLGISVDTAARYRARLGYGPAPQPTPATRDTRTLAEKWATFTRPTAGGHMEWTGRRRPTCGTMEFTHHGRQYAARRVAFEIRTGRAPEGVVTAECDYPECVAPQCVEDEPGRTRLRAALAAVRGTESPLTECTRGHDAATHRRYDRNGTPYCGACRALTDARKVTA
ncbi:hypothetical protein [Streptomyces sp. enrichment culture]|uniref:hypothetical protein n=1 Tax=Streptomyces sp. enrichment culture TaxID=1795815 RepID=UPI003F566BBB